MKKILMAVMLLLIALCGTAFAQNASDFTVDANGVITKYIGFDTVVVIPATIAGKKITAIGNESFRKADITSVTISVGITTIGDYAFSENKLTSVTIPNSVISIGGSAFERNQLTSVTIPNGITSIGKSAFANNKITSVTIPGSVKEIGEGAFRNNTALSTIVISEGVECIERGAFANTRCKNVSLPSTIREIGTGFFSVMYQWDLAFDTEGKPSFTLAANIHVDFDYYPMFYSYITNDRKAGIYAFDMPYVEKKADDYKYYQTQYGAVLVEYTGDSTRVRIPTEIDGVVIKALYETFKRKSLVAVQIPEGITYIGESTFAGNQLVTVTIPNSVTYIGEKAFRENQLTSITIPNGVMGIGYSAFSENKLTSITISNSVTYIGEKAFYSNELRSVTIPNGVTYIGSLAFAGKYNYNPMTSVTFLGTITASNFDYDAFGVSDDLRDKYLAGGRGRYAYSNNRWTKQQ
jgi:hypothetical protein